MLLSLYRYLFLAYYEGALYMASPPAVRLRSPQPQGRTSATFSWFLLIMANVLWAASYVVSKVVLFETSVTIMLALRMGISALILLPFLIARRKDLNLTRQAIPQLLI